MDLDRGSRLLVFTLGLALSRCNDERETAARAPEPTGSVAAPSPSGVTPNASVVPDFTDPAERCRDDERGVDNIVADLKMGRRLPAEDIERLLRVLACRHRDRSTLIEIGRSHLGRPILALAIGHGVDTAHRRPSILLAGAHHGNEPLSAAFVLDAVLALMQANDERLERVLAELTVVAVPLVNPDGYVEAGRGIVMGRKNARDNDGDGAVSALDGVDINRNFPFRWSTVGEPWGSSEPMHARYRGPSPGSEPETQAIMRLANAERFVAAISYHTGTSRILVPYTVPDVKSPEPNVAWSVARLVQGAGRHPEGYVNIETRLYPVDGVEQDWLMYEHGTIALLVEGSSTPLVAPGHVPRLFAAIRSGWVALAERCLDGPTLSGRVTDASGAPVDAEVSIDEIHTREGERWTTRCRDGRFDRLLPAPGRYHLRVRAPGVAEVAREVEVGPGRVNIDVVLPITLHQPAQCPTWTRVR